MRRYPWITIIGGSQVDMDDALRFAASLLIRDQRHSPCPEVDGDHRRFVNIWRHGPGSALERAREIFEMHMSFQRHSVKDNLEKLERMEQTQSADAAGAKRPRL